MKPFPLCLVLPLAALAQQTAAPTPEAVGEARGAMAGNYNILQDWELGYRLLSTAGNLGKYRSDVNFGNGIRLLSSRLAVRSRDGHGAWFDEFTLSTQGLGNDPYQSATLRLARNRLYRYDAVWRSNTYFNPASPLAGGSHRLETTRRIQDHDLIFFPQSSFRVFAGWSRVTQKGAGLTTANLFDGVRGDEFVLSSNIGRRQTEFRIGNQFQLFGIKLHWLHAWERYRESDFQSLPAPSAGADPAGQTSLASLSRLQPSTGAIPSFRLHLLREQGRRWAFNGRFTWSGGRRSFSFDETALGSDRFGSPRNRQVLVAGDARRPVATGHVNLTLMPAGRLTLAHHSSFHSTRMEGDSTYRELNDEASDLTILNFQYLGIRTFTSSTSANYKLFPALAASGGYSFADRQIRSIERAETGGFSSAIRSEQSNRLQAGTAGLVFRPGKPVQFSASAEIGRQAAPFYPTSDKNYHSLSARFQWRPRSFRFGALARAFSNFNSTSLAVHSLRSRHYALDASYNPRDWFSLDASYSKSHLQTLTGVAYFLGSTLLRGQPSVLISNLHHGYFGTRIALRSRADLYLGLSIARDAGFSSARPLPASEAFRAVQTFPMEFDSPLARLSLRLTSRIRWNAGYQYYRYTEDLIPMQNYRAHTAFTSVLWTF